MPRAPSVQAPPRLVQPLPGGGSLFAMPALDGEVAITRLIGFTPANVGSRRPTIQGDVVVFDIATGERRLLLDGPTVTARRAAAGSLLAACRLAPETPDGPLPGVGAGTQGRAIAMRSRNTGGPPTCTSRRGAKQAHTCWRSTQMRWV